MARTVRRLIPHRRDANTAGKYAIDVLLWSAVAPLAFLLRLEAAAAAFLPGLVAYTALGVVVKAGAVYGFGLHLRPWRWVGVSDLFRIMVAVGTVALALSVASLALSGVVTVPRSIPIIEGVLAVLVLGAFRMSRRLRHERTRRPDRDVVRRVLVAGAGDAGVLLARELLRHPESHLEPVGFLDDDRFKARHTHVGLPILGTLDELEAVVDDHGIDEVLLALPTVPSPVLRGLVEAARRAGVPSRTVPRLADIASGEVSIMEVRDVDLEDLLGRDPVRLDAGPIRDYIAGRTVLVTGAGGSIGSEIVRQIAPFKPAAVVLLGRGENSIYHIDREVATTWPGLQRHPVICDVRDRVSLRAAFERFRPDVVFHAAAHKHVPLMEANPEQAVLNNVVGTRNLAELAREFGADRLVNVSTDKAVNPTNVMGASKRAAEMVVSRTGTDGACTMVSVRFGNVLGSRGSVVPLFRDQIAKGGPITVTHPDMVRYFMTIPEAAQLVLQAGASAETGRVYVLDMGEPVRIADLARDLILLSGLEPGVDVDIVFSGARPGEKLFEELLLAEEGTEPGPHEKIFVARKRAPAAGAGQQIEALVRAAEEGTPAEVRAAFRELVTTYAPEDAVSDVPASDGSTGDGLAPNVRPPQEPTRPYSLVA